MIHKRNIKLLNKNLNFVATQKNFNKTTLNKNWEIFTDVSNSKPVLSFFENKALLKKTYSENQRTKPGLQITIATV